MSVLAITSGTGAYSEARGEMALHARNAEGTEYDFMYMIERKTTWRERKGLSLLTDGLS